MLLLKLKKIICGSFSGNQIIEYHITEVNFLYIFLSYEGGNCVSNSSFKWIKNEHISAAQGLNNFFLNLSSG